MNEDKNIVDYWQGHKAALTTQHRLPPKVLLSPADVFATGVALTTTCQPVQAIVNSIYNAASGGDKWQYKDTPYPYYTYTYKTGSTIVSYKPELVRIALTDDEMYRQVQSFDDLDADLIMICCAQLAHGPLEKDQRSTWIFASNILKYRGISAMIKTDKRSGKTHEVGFRTEDLQRIDQSMWRIQNLWITLEHRFAVAPKRKPKTDANKTDTNSKKHKPAGPKYIEYTYDERVFSVDALYRQRSLDELPKPGEPPKPNFSPPIGWKIRAGDWLQVFIDRREVGYLSKTILNYDPYHEMWEKRLARYFFFLFRMNGNYGEINRAIGPFLKQLSLPIDTRDPTRCTRKPFEKAMDRMVKDGHITSWEYKEEIKYPRQAWLTTWLDRMVTIYVAPPKNIVPAISQNAEGNAHTN